MDDRFDARPSFWQSPLWAVCAVVAAATSVYLYAWLPAQPYALVPSAMFALCPLMHILMHRGHPHRGASPGHNGLPNAGPRSDAR